MTLCYHCKKEPVTGKQKMYCSQECYRQEKRRRERTRKTPPKPTAKLRTCLGPCGQPFLSDHKFNRVCGKCALNISHYVSVNGSFA